MPFNKKQNGYPRAEVILFKRFLFTLVVICFIRFGTLLPVPGINHNNLVFYVQRHTSVKNLINIVSDDNSLILGLFTLNIFPYINATVFMQLLIGFSPRLGELQKEADLKSRRTISSYTRITTLIFAIIQSLGITSYLKQALVQWNPNLACQTTLWLTSGAMIVLWLSELITDFGLGTGPSLLIYINIVSNLPTLAKNFVITNSEKLTNFSKIGFITLILISLFGIIFLQEGYRRINLISSRQLNSEQLENSREANYLPLRYNQAGVMPIILTSALLVIPNSIVNLRIFQGLNFLLNFKLIYWIGYFSLVLASSCFYSSIILNPKDISDNFQKSAVAIPGLRPGVQTTFYLKRVIRRITLIGATMLAVITVIPNLIESTLGIGGLSGFSTTSFLILAGVLSDLGDDINDIFYSTY